MTMDLEKKVENMKEVITKYIRSESKKMKDLLYKKLEIEIRERKESNNEIRMLIDTNKRRLMESIK